MHFIKALVKDIIEQSWTLLGMAIAWLVLEGSAKDLTLTLIGATLLVWVVTFPLFRYEKEEKEDAPAKKKPLRKAAFNPNAKDGDGDGVIQDGTIWERKAPKAKK
jgi:aspartyl-tRNA synthetase